MNDNTNTNFCIAKYEKIGSLNVLKFILAVITFLFHWQIHYGVVYSDILFNKFIRAGAIAMSGFFILSGFLLYYIYSKKDFSDFNYLKKFYIKRICKILPSYYLLVLIMYLLYKYFSSITINWSVILVTIIPIQAFLPNSFSLWLVGGLWFISVILFLYFLFPYLCFIVKSVKNITIFSLFIYILGILPLIVDCYHRNSGIYYHPQFRICEFVAGMIAARLFLSSKTAIHHIGFWTILTTIAIYITSALLISNNFLNHHKFNFMSLDVIMLILFPLLIYQLSSIKNKVFILITNNKISDYLGNIAFSFFLTQFLCQFWVKNYLQVNNYYGMNSIELLILSFIVNMLMAIFMYEFFEKRISKILINKFIK